MTKASAGVKKPKRTPPDPGKEVEELRDKVRELEETLDAIRSGEVDAIIVAKGDAQQIYTLEGADHPYQILVENIREGVLTLSRSGMILYTNTRFAEMVKLPLEELPGTSFFDYICPEHCLEIEDAMREIQGRDFKGRARIRHGSSSLPVLITMASFSQDEKTTISVVIADRSIEEKRIFFQAKMLDAVGDAVVALDTDQKIIYWNDAATKTYGWKQKEVLGRNFVELTESKVSEKEIQAIGKHLEMGEIWSGEYIVRHRDGHLFPVFANSSPIFDDNKNLIAVIHASHDITERKGAEEKLRTSYEFTSTILESIGGSLITLDKNWHFTYINQRAVIPNISPEDLIGKSIWEVFPEIIGTPLETLYREVMASRKPAVYENKSRVAHGRYFELHVYPVGDSGLAIFGQDITERKEAELALREAQERTITILEGIADTYYSLDTHWRFSTVNPAAEKAPFGRPATELLGKVIWDLYPALVGTRIHQHYLDAAEKHTLEHYEAQSPLNGLWYEVFMQGREGGVDVYMRDITERREAEEALRESERRYKELVESANSIIIKMDKEGKISFVNEFAQNYFGYSLNELLGQDVRILIPETESSSGRRLEEMTNSILKNPDDFAENINENVRKNGERVWISWRNRAIRDSDGNVIGNLAIGQDITERRKAEEALRYSEENLLQAQELLEAVTKGTDVIIAVQDTNFRYIYFNQPYKEEIKRLTGKDLTIGSSMIEVFAEIPKEQKMSLHEWAKVLNGEKVNQTIAFGSPGSMNHRIYHVLHTPIRDADGTIIAAGEVAYDVTRQIQVEDALRE
ncbi:MAG: PAS domain-containing protein, partial [Methanoregula sp.]|nr:PAS domain-containing protein [Methanoregula sp.]